MGLVLITLSEPRKQAEALLKLPPLIYFFIIELPNLWLLV
jgi:hypothetical protein